MERRRGAEQQPHQVPAAIEHLAKCPKHERVRKAFRLDAADDPLARHVQSSSSVR